MSHFAQVDQNDIVLRVIVAEQDWINSGAVGEPSSWIQTSYNTQCGVHPEGRPLRYNYAGIGYTYDRVNDAFIAPKPYPSWILNSGFCWDPPTPYPLDGGVYKWDEGTLSWEEIVL